MKNIIAIFGLILLVLTGVSQPIGNTNDATTIDAGLRTDLSAMRYLASTNITASNIWAKVTAISGNYKCAVYTDNSGLPNNFLIGTSQRNVSSNGWAKFDLTSQFTFTNGQYYWLAIWSSSDNAGIYYSANGTVRWQSGYTYGTWPSPLSLSGSSSAYNYCIYATNTIVTPPTVITNLPATNRVTLRWDRSPDVSVTGYKIYLGPTSAGYTNSVTVGNVTNAVISNLVATTTYFFAATAYESSGLESDFSNETIYTVPSPTAPTNTPPAILQNFRFF